MATATITFPDSGRTLEIERVSFLTLSMLNAHYERNYQGKPSIPMVKIDDTEEPNPNDATYLKDLAAWQQQMNNARWLATKVLYAKGVKNVDHDAVTKAIADVADYMSLPEEIKNAYQEIGVPFDMNLIDEYIYLWHVCITNSTEQSILQTEMIGGSGAAHDAVQNAVFRLRSQV